MYQVVLDTNVVVAALRSRNGASWQLLRDLDNPAWRANLTVAVALEYEAVLRRESSALNLGARDVDDILDALCSRATLHRQYFSQRPALRDPNDELILEAAVASQSEFIITFNKRDFVGSEHFGVRCVSPKEFLILLRRQP